jgi:hypothetical protein
MPDLPQPPKTMGQRQPQSSVRLSPPWSERAMQQVCITQHPNEHEVQDFIVERTRVHERFIAEEAKTKRLGLILTAVLILGSGAVVLFAPPGRETISYWIGAALLIFAAGASGYGRVWAKTKGASFGADKRDR